MEIYGSHFEYAGVNSRKYGLIIATVESDRFTSVTGETDTISLFNKRDHTKYYITDDTTDAPLTFEAEITSDEPLEKWEQREVEKWLFLKRGYYPLYFDVDDDVEGTTWDMQDGVVRRYYFNCRLTNPLKLEYNGGIVGYTVTIECDSPAAWQEPITKVYPVEGGSLEMTIKVDTDMNEYVYPIVRIDGGSSGGTLSIVNLSDSEDRKTTFEGLQGDAVFRMDGRTNYISGEAYYKKFKDKNFVRFLDGENKLQITGDLKQISFEWQNRRYL